MRDPSNPPLFVPENNYLRTDVTLRDLLAGMAMQGMLAADVDSGWAASEHSSDRKIAEGAYRLAGAMLAARGRNVA